MYISWLTMIYTMAYTSDLVCSHSHDSVRPVLRVPELRHDGFEKCLKRGILHEAQPAPKQGSYILPIWIVKGSWTVSTAAPK